MTAQKEYIITEEQLLFFKPDFLSEKTHYQKVFQEVRSRPYNPEAVLEELQEKIAEHCGGGIHTGWVLAHPIDIWIAKKKNELRHGE